jgi:hypothetical protein
MQKIAACAVVGFLGSAAIFGSATYATAAELAEKQWSVLFPDHTAIPEKFGAPIHERFSDSDTMQLPGVQMPVPASGREVTPDLAEPRH